MLLIATMTTTSLASIPVIEDAEAGGVGLRVLVHGGEGQVCIDSDNEDAGCGFADGGTLEFEFSPGAVEVGDTFSVCDNNGCETGRNGEEKAPEHVYLGGGGGGSGSSESRSDVVQDFCSKLSDGDYAGAEALLFMLDYGSLSAAARGLCGIVQLLDN
jgi:hypothetical protein